MLEVENLTARYPRASRPVIDGLSFSLGEGGLLALLGPSGCGKTTLLNLLAGVLPPAGGSVRFCGAPLSPRDTAIGLIPQSYGLLPWKTVRENCLFCARPAKGSLTPSARGWASAACSTATRAN